MEDSSERDRRRAEFLGGATALTGSAAPAAAGSATPPPEPPAAGPFAYDRAVWTVCHVNCGSRCPLRMYVRDGVVVRVGADTQSPDGHGPGETYQMRPCARGYTNRQRLYNATRVQTPPRRVRGTKRGEGRYEAITWDEAIDEIARAMVAVRERYGNDAFFIQSGTGQIGGTVSRSWKADQSPVGRLLNCFGGYLRCYSDYSTGQLDGELPLFNGDAYANNEVTDLVNARNIVLWGNNPANTFELQAQRYASRTHRRTRR